MSEHFEKRIWAGNATWVYIGDDVADHMLTKMIDGKRYGLELSKTICPRCHLDHREEKPVIPRGEFKCGTCERYTLDKPDQVTMAILYILPWYIVLVINLWGKL